MERNGREVGSDGGVAETENGSHIEVGSFSMWPRFGELHGSDTFCSLEASHWVRPKLKEQNDVSSFGGRMAKDL